MNHLVAFLHHYIRVVPFKISRITFEANLTESNLTPTFPGWLIVELLIVEISVKECLIYIEGNFT